MKRSQILKRVLVMDIILVFILDKVILKLGINIQNCLLKVLSLTFCILLNIFFLEKSMQDTRKQNIILKLEKLL